MQYKNTDNSSDETLKGDFVAFFIGKNSFYPNKNNYEDKIMTEIERKECCRKVKEMFKYEIEEYLEDYR